MRVKTASLVIPLWAVCGSALAIPVICTYGDLSRKIEVVYTNPGQPVPCEVIYDKSAEGSIEVLWRANNESGYCEARAAELIDRLSGMGWQCESDTRVAEDVPED